MKMRSWKFLFKVKHGHSYFQLADGRVSIADDSGATPDLTDDGPLYLDKSKAITMGWGWDDGSHAFIPLLRENGEPTSSSEPCGGALQVASVFDMRVVVDGDSYEIAQVAVRITSRSCAPTPHVMSDGACSNCGMRYDGSME